MSYEDKILDKFADMIMPPGTIIAYQGIEAPEGFIVYDHIKIYEDEFPRLYPVLAANPNFNKGADSDGRKWVELPEIEDLCIQMTTDTSQVGKTLEAQLPNIQGTTQCVGYVARNWQAGLNADGPFSGMQRWQYLFSIGSDATDGSVIEFNANLDNSIYCGESMQPKSLQALCCIRC